MARMRTNSASYFPMDVSYFNDRKIRRLRRECGDLGIILHLYLLCCTYSDSRGYYTEADENLIFDLSERFDVGEAEILKIFKIILEVGLFDKEIYEKHKLITSHSIQLRFQEIVRRKATKKAVIVEECCWLLNENETQQYIVVEKSGKGDTKSGKGDTKSGKGDTKSGKGDTQSAKNAINKIKEKEIKENEIKAEEDMSAAAALITEYEATIGRATATVCEGIQGYLEGGVEKELLSRLIQYALEQGKCSWQYVEAAAEGNIREGILTLDDYNKNREKRAKNRQIKGKSGGFNNYTDTNRTDYTAISEGIIADMLREAENYE